MPWSRRCTNFICNVHVFEPGVCSIANRSSFVYICAPDDNMCQSLRLIHDIWFCISVSCVRAFGLCVHVRLWEKRISGCSSNRSARIHQSFAMQIHIFHRCKIAHRKSIVPATLRIDVQMLRMRSTVRRIVSKVCQYWHICSYAENAVRLKHVAEREWKRTEKKIRNKELKDMKRNVFHYIENRVTLCCHIYYIFITTGCTQIYTFFVLAVCMQLCSVLCLFNVLVYSRMHSLISKHFDNRDERSEYM